MTGEAGRIEFELDFLIFVILSENPGMNYHVARKQAMEEIKEMEE